MPEEWDLPTGEFRTESTPEELRKIGVHLGIKIKKVSPKRKRKKRRKK